MNPYRTLLYQFGVSDLSKVGIKDVAALGVQTVVQDTRQILAMSDPKNEGVFWIKKFERHPSITCCMRRSRARTKAHYPPIVQLRYPIGVATGSV